MGITAVIPTYNRETLIERAVESVLDQHHRADAVIVVDDGSTDETLERLGHFGDEITIISQANAGASAARNAGAAAAATPWLAFCDSDDHWTPEHLTQLAAAVTATDGAAALYFDDTRIDPADGGGTFFEVAGLRLSTAHEVSLPVVSWVFGSLQPMLLQSSLIRASAYRSLGGLATELAVRHDTHLFFQIGFCHPMCAVRGVGGHLAADASADDRLTGSGGPASTAFWNETLWMFNDLSRMAPDSGTARWLRRRVAATYVKLGASAARDGGGWEAIGHLTRGFVRSPLEVGRLALAGARRRLSRRPRNERRIPR